MKDTGGSTLSRGSMEFIMFEGLWTHLLESVSDLLLFGNVSCVEWGVMVLLYNVEHRHRIPPCQKLLYDVSSDETTSAKDDIVVALQASA